MKNKIKGIAIVILISVVAICVLKVFGNDESKNETSNEGKGSYSYYYSDPTFTTEDSTAGINFYEK